MKTFIFSLILSFAYLSSSFGQLPCNAIISDSNNITVVRLCGTSQERGFWYGYLIGEKITECGEGVIKPWYGDDYEAARQLVIEGTNIIIDPVYREEAKAVIAGMDSAGTNTAGYDYVDILVGNLYNDMFWWDFSNKKQGMFCSTFLNWGDATLNTDLNGASVISRHLDNYNIPAASYNTGVIVCHIPSEEDLQPWLMIDFAGSIGTTSGLNSSGYSIFQNSMGWGWSPDTNKVYNSVRFLIQQILADDIFHVNE